MRVAGLQSDIVWEDPQQNFERLQPRLAAAAAAGARLVVLPEMFACGFTMQAERVEEGPDGPSIGFLRQQAQRHGLWLAGSLPERPEGSPRPFNTLVVASPEGQLHRYRKLHPFSLAKEDEHYGSGDGPVSVEIEGLRCSLFICYDLRFADEFWATAETSDAYIVVANWPIQRRRHWKALLLARAIENQAFVIGVNRVGSGGGHDYSGDSCIVDPSGELLASAASQETMLLADLDPERVRDVRRRFPFLKDRR